MHKCECCNEMFVEIIIRDHNEDEVGCEQFEQYLEYETEGMKSYLVPSDWIGFKDGTAVSLLKKFGESIYFSLAYLTIYDDEIISDFNGNKLSSFEVLRNGKYMKKYVKRKLQIINVLDKDKEQFTLKRYCIDIMSSNPLVIVCDLFSVGQNGGIRLSSFMDTKKEEKCL